MNFKDLKTVKGDKFIDDHYEKDSIPSKYNNYTQFLADHYICEIYLGAVGDANGIVNWREYSSRLLRTGASSVKDEVFLIYEEPLSLSIINTYKRLNETMKFKALNAAASAGAALANVGASSNANAKATGSAWGLQSDIAITPGRFLEAQFYEGTQPLQFKSTFKFRLGQYGLWDAFEEVFKPALSFIMMSSPTILDNGGTIETPGPTQLGLISAYGKGLYTAAKENFTDFTAMWGAIASETGGTAAKHITIVLGQTAAENIEMTNIRSKGKNSEALGSETVVSFNDKLNIENLFSFRPCVLKDCSVVFSKEKTTNGYPISAEVNLKLETQFPVISSNFGNLIKDVRTKVPEKTKGEEIDLTGVDRLGKFGSL